MNLDFMPSPSPGASRAVHPRSLPFFRRHADRFRRRWWSACSASTARRPISICAPTLVRTHGRTRRRRRASSNLIDTLSNAGFLEDDIFARMQEAAQREFAASPVREPAHAGSAYPGDAAEMRETMAQYMAGRAALRHRTAICSASPRRTSARRAAGNATAPHTACCGRSTRIARS